MSEENKETAIEQIDVEEEVTPEIPEVTWTEELVIAGGGLLSFLQSLIHETSIRRITVRNSEGRVLFDVPAAVGLIAVVPPVLMYSLVALGFAVMAEYSVTIERVAKKAPETIAEESIIVTDE